MSAWVVTADGSAVDTDTGVTGSVAEAGGQWYGAVQSIRITADYAAEADAIAAMTRVLHAVRAEDY
jgi:hypothetical protein